MDGRLGEETFTGTYKAGELKLAGEHYAAEAGYTSVMRISGKIVDGKIKGTATWGDYDLTFTAVKSTE
jgi:hypothetical protein